MPKVLHILNRPHFGGPILYAGSLIQSINKDFESRLLVGELSPKEEDATAILTNFGIKPMVVKGMERNISPWNDFKVYWRLRRIIRHYNPDIVHTNGAKAGALGRLAANHERVPVIIHTFHGHVFKAYFSRPVSWMFLQIERYLANITTKIISISKQQTIELCNEFHVAELDKIETIPLGFDFNRFVTDQAVKRKRFRDEFKISDDAICIGIVGRMVPVKDHKFFIKAISKILREAKVPIKAFIVGDGETRNAIEEYAVALGLPFTNEYDRKHQHPLIFTSWRTDIDCVFAGLDIVTLCSKNEGTPVTLMEAQAAEKPIVATKVGGVMDTVLEGETALLCEAGDLDGYCQQLLSLVHDAEIRHRLTTKSRSFVLKNFHHSEFIQNTESLYRRLIAATKK
ncbi:MAG: glycosyltransferase [Saprospiraceae bacterium]|nr:glycosyltransferase [Saprospiraceae bacterium]